MLSGLVLPRLRPRCTVTGCSVKGPAPVLSPALRYIRDRRAPVAVILPPLSLCTECLGPAPSVTRVSEKMKECNGSGEPPVPPGVARSSCCSRTRSVLRQNSLVLLTIAGVVLGAAVGMGLRPLNMSPVQIAHFSFPGELLIRLLKMIILPLVVCSLVSGAASLQPSALGRLGGWALLFFLVTTLLASALGVSLALLIRPGEGAGEGFSKGEEVEAKEVVDSFLDLIR